MRSRLVLAIAAVLVLATSVRADEQLVQALKQLGGAVDNVSINISKAESDADAELLANVTKQTLANNFNGVKPEIEITASKGSCSVLMTTPAWRLWSKSQDGKVVDHGAKIN